MYMCTSTCLSRLFILLFTYSSVNTTLSYLLQLYIKFFFKIIVTTFSHCFNYKFQNHNVNFYNSLCEVLMGQNQIYESIWEKLILICEHTLFLYIFSISQECSEDFSTEIFNLFLVCFLRYWKFFNSFEMLFYFTFVSIVLPSYLQRTCSKTLMDT